MAPTNGGCHVRFKATGRVSTRFTAKLSLLTLAVGLLALSACGSSSSSTTSSASAPATTPATTTSAASSTPAPATGGAASSSLSLSANPEGQLKYSTTTLTAKAGQVSI